MLSDGQGVASTSELLPGRYAIEVSFPGFETAVVTEYRVRAGDNRREVMLAIKKLDESVAVGRDPATSASDPEQRSVQQRASRRNRSTRCPTIRTRWRRC